MAGFTISCNNCGNKIVTGDDYKAKNDKISLFAELRQFGTINEYVENTLWCENCDNSTEFNN
jgi:hypothetical protein